MQLPSRSEHLAAAGGVCDRSRHRAGRRSQPLSATATRATGGGEPATGLVSGGRQARHRRTVVQRPRARRGGAGGIHRAQYVRRVATHYELTFVVHSSRSSHPPVHQGRITRWCMRLVHSYQQAREGYPSPCRFTPSCSAYGLEALQQHGAARGMWLMFRRFLRCRPFGPSGWDPVPEPFARKRVPA